MTEQATPFQFAGAEASPQPSSPAQPAESGGQEGQAQTDNGTKYLTEDGARQLFEAMFNSKGQSITARTENRVRKLLETAQAQGLNLTAQQAQSLLDTADAERQAGQQSQPQQQQQAQQQAQPAQPPAREQASQGQSESVHPVIAVANEMIQRAGVTISDDDPEAKLIDQTTDNPAVFLASIQAAIEAKRRRQEASGSPARIPSLGGGGRPANPVLNVNDPNELWKLARGK